MRAKKTYAAVTRSLNPEGRIDKLRLDKNEHTYGLPPAFVSKALEGLTPELLASYPEVRPLYAKLAQTYAISERNLMLASGSDAAIKAFYEAFVSEGDEVVLLDPSYAMFHVYAKLSGAKVVDISYGPGLRLDAEAVLAAIHPGVSMVAIANPNSPTGTIIEQPLLLEIVQKAQHAGVPILIDEAYHPFCPETVLPHIGDYDHLAVTRTFSKAFGIASLRLGFMAAHETLIDVMMKARPMYEINGVAAHFGCYLLDHMDVVEAYVREVEQGKQYLIGQMEDLGFEPYPTHANFMLIPIPDAELRDGIGSYLHAQGILMTSSLVPPLEACIRISLGPKRQMAVVATHIREFMEGRSR